MSLTADTHAQPSFHAAVEAAVVGVKAARGRGRAEDVHLNSFCHRWGLITFGAYTVKGETA